MPHKDPEKRRAYAREWQQRWRLLNRDAALAAGRESQRRYRECHPEKYKTRQKSLRGRYTQLKNKAKRHNFILALTFDQYRDLIASGLCHYCGRSLDEWGYALDRKNNEPRYCSDSCVPCCGRCNRTFNSYYTYEQKLILAEAIRRCDQMQGITENSRVRELPKAEQGLLFP